MDDEVLKKLIKSLEESNKKTIEEANKKQSEELKQHINEEIHVIKLHFEEELLKKNTEFENKYGELKVKFEKLEKELRKNNIIIFGLDAPADNVVNYVIKEINERLGLIISVSDINNIYTIGKQPTKRPIIVKLLSYIKKEEILKNSKKLKGTNVSIAEDLTLEERNESKILREHLKIARGKNLNAIIRNRKLIINGQQYRACDLAEEVDTGTDDRDHQDCEFYEAKNKAVRLANSDPATPKKTQEEFLLKTGLFEPEEYKVQDIPKKKTTKHNQPAPPTARTSNRLNSNKEQKKYIDTKGGYY